ncbi:MAG: FIST C-terminal domain-containing protein [Synergistaceae bacterium]|jgi:hypothetical protein|nr:FIST C-terminal domain-containing protein [Synergistaceae bacterium]
MIDMYTSFTEEIDDVRIAVGELRERIDAHGLLKNSVGILHCNVDFVESGVVSGLCAELPFDVIGGTTISASTYGIMSKSVLILTVLTSDVVAFATGVSDKASDDASAAMRELYGRVTDARTEPPVLLMPFFPHSFKVGGDEFLSFLDEASGGVQAFGGFPVSGGHGPDENFTIYNGEAYEDAAALLALYGDVDPDFFIVSVDHRNIMKQKAVATIVERNMLKTVNNMPAFEFLKSKGITINDDVAGLETMALIFYPEDGGEMLIRMCMKKTPEGWIVMSGGAPAGSTIALSVINPDSVIRSMEEGIWSALAAARGRGMLMYSCAARFWALGISGMGEHKKAMECVGKASPYLLSYSGGEIFPIRRRDGRTVNSLLNDSLIICVL